MPAIGTPINTTSEEWRSNSSAHEAAAAEIDAAFAIASAGGGMRAFERHRSRGKLPVRERIGRLLDPGSSFMEIGALAAYQVYEDNVAAGGLVTGIGAVSSLPCMIIANDATVKGGTYYPLTITKQLRAQDVARALRLPCIYLVDSGGAFLPLQHEIFPGEHHFGRIFRNIAQMSALGLPQVAAVMGSCTAGGAYVPAMCDETVIVRGSGTIFLGGPQLVQAATGEIVDAETLGGAELHTRRSAVADHLAESDIHAIQIVRNIVARSPGRRHLKAPLEPIEPRFPTADIPGLISRNPRQPYPIREVIARLVDGSRFEPYRELWGQTLLCGTAAINGFPVGILANDGVLFGESAQKGANFIELCCQRDIPLLFLHNISGFMVGEAYEATGIARHGAKMVNAVACANVPKFSVILGGSFGAGNYAMCGRAFEPTLMAMWPNARTAVMGGEQAATVLALVREQQRGQEEALWTDDEREAFKEPIRRSYEAHSHPIYAAARLWVDAVITPAQTRSWLTLGLSLAASLPREALRFGVFRM